MQMQAKLGCNTAATQAEKGTSAVTDQYDGGDYGAVRAYFLFVSREEFR